MTMLKTIAGTNTKVIDYFRVRLGVLCQKLSEIQTEITLQIPTEYASKFKDFF
jgi:hypothetical protein